jgi:hypothetical protein
MNKMKLFEIEKYNIENFKNSVDSHNGKLDAEAKNISELEDSNTIKPNKEKKD